MLPRIHTFLGVIFTLTIAYFFNLSWAAGITIVLSSVLIDVDHYLYYVYKKKDLSLIKAYNWFIIRKKKFNSLPRKKRNQSYTSFSFLHGLEILILLFVLGKFISVYFYYVLIGFSFHLFLDLIYQRTVQDRIDRIFIVYDFIKFKKLGFIKDVK